MGHGQKTIHPKRTNELGQPWMGGGQKITHNQHNQKQGKIISHRFESNVLKSNPLKDPYTRDLTIYLPPEYSKSNSEGYTAVFCLVGYGGTGKMLLNVDPFSETIEDRMNRLISEKKCGPLVLVLVDCFTRFGGSQYINSSATGMYEDYIVKEIVPFIDKNYNVSRHAVMGHSSGGYGALVLGMHHPDTFQAVADHSGDSAFEYCYLPDFPKALDVFRRAEGDPKKWLEEFWQKPNKYQDGKDMAALSIFGMAAHYSPNPQSEYFGVDFPFDLESGEIKQEVWNRWLSLDPVRMMEKYHDNLKKLKLIYIDCGTEDEFNMLWGCRMIHSKLDRMGIPHYYEEFPDGHRRISYRYDVSLPMVYHSLSATARG
jgi:enterochelin esterase-like enzyme